MIARAIGVVLGAALGVLALAGCGAPGPTEPAAAQTATSLTTPESSTTAVAPPTSAAAVETTTTTPPAPIAESATPQELAARIAAAERTVRDPTSAPEALGSAAFDLQLAYRQLGRQPAWEPAVLAALPTELQHAAWLHASARREFRSMHSTLSDTLPAWRIVDPAPMEDLLDFYREGEATYGVPWEVLAAVNLVETGLGRIRGTSIAGAQGPMQFMPATWAAFGEGDVDDPHDAILASARYLAHNGGGSGDLANALYNYNHDQSYVRGVLLYAEILARDPQAFRGLYHWQVVYLSSLGDVWLAVGFDHGERVPAAEYVAAHPERHLGPATN